jgi:hypothetical protein
MEMSLKIIVLLTLFVFLIYLMSWNDLLPKPYNKKAKKYFSSSYLVTGTLGKTYMISIYFENATAVPFQKENQSNRTFIYFGNGWLSINNLNPNDILFGFNDNEDQTLAVRIADLNRLIEFTPNVFGTWEK